MARLEDEGRGVPARRRVHRRGRLGALRGGTKGGGADEGRRGILGQRLPGPWEIDAKW